MQFVKNFNRIIGFIFLIMFSRIAISSVLEKKCGDYIFWVEEKCGEYTFEVKITNGHSLYDRQFTLYYKSQDGGKKLFYKADISQGLDTACIQNKGKKYLMLFNEYCSGNSCPEDIFGVFDPSTGKMLINPSEWPKGNYKEVQKLIGSSPPLFKSKELFCCRNQLYGYGD